MYNINAKCEKVKVKPHLWNSRRPRLKPKLSKDTQRQRIGAHRREFLVVLKGGIRSGDHNTLEMLGKTMDISLDVEEYHGI